MGKMKGEEVPPPRKGSKKDQLFQLIRKHYRDAANRFTMDPRLRFDRSYAEFVAAKLKVEATANVYRMLLELERDHKLVKCTPIGDHGDGKIVQIF